MTATTALTAQNTLDVLAVFPVPPQFVRKQIEACFADIGVDVVKTGGPSEGGARSGDAIRLTLGRIGMMASGATIQAVAEALEVHNPKAVVVDPVCPRDSAPQRDTVH